MVVILSQQSATLTHTNQKTIPCELEFIITSGLRLSCLGHSIEIKTDVVNEVTSSGYYFVVQSYANSLHRIPSFTCQLHEHVESLCLYHTQNGSYP